MSKKDKLLLHSFSPAMQSALGLYLGYCPEDDDACSLEEQINISATPMDADTPWKANDMPPPADRKNEKHPQGGRHA